MVAAVLALLAAVVVTVTYRVLTEHLDYASVRRRQLDVWAATAAIACFGLIVYGNATTPRVQAPTPADSGEPEGRPVDPVRRITQPTSPEPLQPVLEPVDVVVVVAAGDGESAVAVADVPAESVRAVAPAQQSRPHATREMIYLGQETPTPTVAVLVLATSAAASPTARAADPPSSTPRPTTVQRPQPTSVPPTDQPPPMPTATPHCGDPNEIRIVVSPITARRADVGSDIVVDYQFGIRNESTFPVTVAKMRITVTRLGGGAEEFASHALDDVTIEPGAVYPVARSITLETRPPPVGEVNLCLTYRTETCNEGLPRGGNRCRIVDGF